MNGIDRVEEQVVNEELSGKGNESGYTNAFKPEFKVENKELKPSKVEYQTNQLSNQSGPRHSLRLHVNSKQH